MSTSTLRPRSSSRLAFLLQTSTRLAALGMSLVWTRLLLREMGLGLNGLFLSFQTIAALGGLGDLGLGGAVGIRATRMLGEGVTDELKRFLGAARAFFFLIAATVTILLMLGAPGLPQVLRFPHVEGAGPLWCLFLLAGPAAGLVVLQSYISNLNHVSGNLIWPSLPPLISSQAAFFCHWWLASQHQPLWVQYLPYVLASAFVTIANWSLLKRMHPALGAIFPIRWDPKEIITLIVQSSWIYIIALGNYVYLSTDRLIINGLFGSDQVPRYQFNYKACEVATYTIITASFVTIPWIAQILCSGDSSARVNALTQARRVNQFQVLLGTVAAIGYLLLNDLFIEVWLGPNLHVPVLWQGAFAANMVVTLATSVVLDLTNRLDDQGLRFAGTRVGVAALINLVLSLSAAVLFGSILGIAVATVIAQTYLAVELTRHLCTRYDLSTREWLWASVGWPLGAVVAMTSLRMAVPPTSIPSAVVLCFGAAAVGFVVTRGLGFNRASLLDGWKLVRGKAKLSG